MNPNDPDKLEAAIHGMLRKLPDRKAPPGLEARVLAELGRRASLPWWRRSFAHWPRTVQAAFFAGSALVVAGLVILGRSAGVHQVSSGISNAFTWLVFARDVIESANGKVRMVIASIPPIWMYGVAGTITACYLALAAIGAAAYRALSFGRRTS